MVRHHDDFPPATRFRAMNYAETAVQVRQALQELLAAAEKAADIMPGGLVEGLDLHIAIENARRFV